MAGLELIKGDKIRFIRCVCYCLGTCLFILCAECDTTLKFTFSLIKVSDEIETILIVAANTLCCLPCDSYCVCTTLCIIIIRKIKIVECTFPYAFPWQRMFNVIMSLIITLHY